MIAFRLEEIDNIFMSIAKEIFVRIDPEFRVAKLNRIEVADCRPRIQGNIVNC